MQQELGRMVRNAARAAFPSFLMAALLLVGLAGFPAAAAADNTTPAAAPVAVPPAQQVYAGGGPGTCLKCHDSNPKVVQILQTPHSTKGDPHSPFGQEGCEACHGPSAAHVASRQNDPAVVFVGPNKSSVDDRNKQCLACHQAGLRMNWQGSQHQNNDLACNDCHTVHVSKDPVLVKMTQPEKCYTCHTEQRALALQFSHHPINEGKVVCSDCHNPHGSPGPKLLKEVRVTDTCYTCHADKRGPFLWEHQPVREDCTNCHNPHGSVNPRLVKEKVPFLCLDCHAATNDMGGSGLTVGALKGPTVTSHGAASAPHSGFYLFGDRSCLNCHSQVHGSNSPSGSTFFR